MFFKELTESSQGRTTILEQDASETQLSTSPQPAPHSAYSLLKRTCSQQSLSVRTRDLVSQSIFSSFSSPTLGETTTNKRILIVDDDGVSRGMLKQTFKKLMPSAKIDEAEDGQKAVESCAKNVYDLIFMDIEMPKINGIKATQLIRGMLRTETPIIAMTTLPPENIKSQCFAAKMNDFLPKPFNPQELKEKINKWLPATGAQEKPAVEEIEPVSSSRPYSYTL